MGRLCRSSKDEGNLKERNRRILMKDHLGRLASLLPHQSSKVSASEILSHATSYIQQLQRKRECLERKKTLLKGEKPFDEFDNKCLISDGQSKPSVTSLRTLDSIVELNLISGLNKNFMLYEIINVLEEGGAEVIHAAHVNAGDKTIYIIKAKAISSRIGVETSILEERLKELIL